MNEPLELTTEPVSSEPDTGPMSSRKATFRAST